MKRSARARVRAPFRVVKPYLRQAVFAALASMQCVVAANPVGGKVIAGSASIQGAGNTLTVRQATDRAIINWQGFSIGAGEVTKFIQPNAGSAALNRVVSGDPSRLLGRLEANGKVFLINPNGILVGGGAVINTHSFVASTRDVSNAQFMAGGDLKFVADSKAGIQNLGSIKADGGDVFLIAHSVDNAGTIEAPRGTVGLAAGTEVLLKHSGDERLYVQTTVGVAGETGVNNSGLVSAVQAELKAAGGNMYALAVNNSGAIHVTGIVEQDGRVLLTSGGGNIVNSGTITARGADGDGGTVRIAGGHNESAPATVVSTGTIDVKGSQPGATGGRVEITGDRVGLTGNARVDASGDAGGGTVLIGGDFQGRNASVDNADTTLVATGARISADAVSKGDGGNVIVWADGSTAFGGEITSRGGAQGGNGGFAEVSGKKSLGFAGHVDLSAPQGIRGTLLLDPKNGRVQNGGTATPGEMDDFSDSPDQDRSIDPLVLAATNADVQIAANNDIFFDSPLALTSPGAALTARAGRNILMADAISTNNGRVILVANETAGVDPAQRDPGAGVIVMQNNASISSGGADVTLQLKPTPDPANSAQFITVSTINAGAGTITLINDGAASNPPNSSIAQVGNGLQASRLIVEGPGQVLLQSLTNNVGQLLLDTRRQLLFNNAGALIVGGTGPTTGFGVGAGDVTIRTLAGDLTNNAPGLPTAGGAGGTVTFDAAGSLRMNDGPNLGAGFLGAPSTVDAVFTAGTNVRILAPLIRARNLRVTATNGTISFETPAGANNFGVVAQDIGPNGVVSLTANGNLTSTATSTISARNLTLTSNNGMIDLDGVVNATSLNATAPGNIALDHPSSNAILQLAAISSGADIAINNFPAFTWSVVGLTRSTAANGRIAINTNTNVQFLPSANCRIETGANGTIVFNAGAGQILDGTTPSFIGGNLLITARAIGGGTTNPLNTQVSRLSGRATRGNNFGGFAYVTNNENAAGPLGIGGLDPDIFGLTADGRDSTGQCISLVNNGSVMLDQGGVFASNADLNAGAITINANGGSSDLMTSVGFFGIAALSDTALNVTAGRDVLVGGGSANGSLASRGTLNVNAGRDVIIEGAQIATLGSGLSNVTAGNAIRVRPGPGNTSAVRSTGAGRITLIAPTIDLDNGSATNPVLRTNEAGSDGSLALTGDFVNIGGRIDAGTGPVSIAPRTNNRPISIGDDNALFLSLSDAELDRVNAGILSIGGFATTGPMIIDQPLSRPATAPTYNALELLNVGSIIFQSDVDLGGAGLVAQALSGDLQGAGAISAATMNAFSSTGSITLSGDLTAQTLTASAPGGSIALGGNLTAQTLTVSTSGGSINLSGRVNAASLGLNAPGGNVFVDNNANNIVTLTGANYNEQFRLRDSVGGMSVTGFVDGGAASSGQIEVRGGNLVLQQGAKVFFGGANRDFRLFSDTGFVNLAGPDALVPENGGRWLIYAPSPQVTQLGGLTAPFTFFSLNYPEVPATNGNTLVYASARPGAQTNTTATTNEVTNAAIDDVERAFLPRPALFRLASIDSPQSTFDRISEQLALISRRSGSIFDAPRDEALAFVDAIEAFVNFLDTELPIAAARADQFQGQLNQINDTLDGRMTRLMAGLATGGIVRGIPELKRRVEGLLEGSSSMADVAGIADSLMEDIGILQKSYVDAASELRLQAQRRAADQVIASAKNYAGGDIVRADNGRPIIVPASPFPLIEDPPGSGVYAIQSIFVMRQYGYSLDNRISTNEINAIVAAGGGNISFGEVSRIVAAGGGNFSPGVVAGIVAAGGGNLTSNQISGIVAAGGGNIRDPLTMNSILSATIVAAGAGNIVAAGAGNIVAAGGGNIVAAGGGNIVAAGGLNLVAAGGMNLIGQDGGSIVAAGGGNIVAAGGGNIVAAGGLNFTANAIANIVAAGGGNITAAGAQNILASGIVAAGGLNLIGLDGGSIVAAGGGNIVAAGGGNIVAAGGGNIVAAGGGNIVAAGAGNVMQAIAAGIVAAGGGNLGANQAAGIVAAGAGNFSTTISQLVAAGAGNLANMANMVAAGAGNLVAAGAGNIAADLARGAALGTIAGGATSFVNNGGAALFPQAGGMFGGGFGSRF